MPNSELMLDNLVSVAPGEPYRLLPFGKYIKGGKVRDVTPEIAARFRLPHFRPPVKLGSHDDTTPAGGTIARLEVREDGLYAVPELTEKGARAIADGDYRYHSPEVIWEGGVEDPNTGEMITAPLIVGDALLHTPHLGESVAMYCYETLGKDETMETVEIPKTFWEKLTAWWDKSMVTQEPEPVQIVQDVEALNAAIAERDALAAKLAEIEAMKAHTERVEKMRAAIVETNAEPNAEMLASMTDEQAEWVMVQLKALSAQVEANDKLTQEIGSEGTNDLSGAELLDATIKRYAAEHGVFYQDALIAVRKEHPELFK